jgi:hypothetical protein
MRSSIELSKVPRGPANYTEIIELEERTDTRSPAGAQSRWLSDHKRLIADDSSRHLLSSAGIW